MHFVHTMARGKSLTALIGCMAALSISAAAPGQQVQVPATLEDYFEPGTQELTLTAPMVGANSCRACHEFEDDGNARQVVPPWDNWSMSVMAHSARDPIWHAALAIANQDAQMSGDTCIRCHAPSAWLSGRSVPTDASAFTSVDLEGINCNFCHRLVDPVSTPGNPREDKPILNALAKAGLLPQHAGNASYVVDPLDTRRGPLDDVPLNLHGVPIIVSQFHRSSALCGTCHDVSNPLYTRQPDGSYALNAYDAPHPTGSPHDMMPEQRTYSEWLNSDFANGGVYFADRRFGGDHPTGVMQSCQDCHMPRLTGGICTFWPDPPFFIRDGVPEHSFVGANTWILGAVYDQYGEGGSSLTPEKVALAEQRTTNFLRAASDMQLAQIGDQIKVRIINWSGHKLPTGYPEGRRMWINVKFYNAREQLIAEHGAYDDSSAVLSTGDTKVYEARFGMDAATAAATNLQQGESFHLVLNNQVLKDNRIPPKGFSNSAYEAIQAAPVAATYADAQFWDDTSFTIPTGATQAVVGLYYQTTSKEYIEFLRDANVTNSAGQNAYDRWVARGKSAPVDMDLHSINLGSTRTGDLNFDGVVNVTDLLLVIGNWGSCLAPNLCAGGDANGDNVVNVTDLLLVIFNWG